MSHRINSADLEYNNVTRVFTAEASELLMLCGLPMPRRIEVISKRTGNAARYVFSRAEMANEDLGAWHYTPDPACPHAATTAGITIWND